MFPWCEYKPLQKDQLDRLLEHKYNSVGESHCDKFMKPFWKAVAKYIPIYVAPNLLTMLGLIFNVIGASLLLIYGVSGVTSLIFGICVFLYQTLDAVDGLHARSTNTGSHLGELFDHGCDAISISLVSVSFCLVVGLDEWPILMFVQYFVLNTNFYLAHWRCYVTGVLVFDRFSTTESLITCIVFSFLTCIFGLSIWTITDPVFGIPLKVLQFFVVLTVVLFTVFRFCDMILQGGCGKYGTTIANSSILFPACPMALVIGLAILIASRSPTNIYHQAPFIYLVTFGAVQTKIIQRLIVAHMMKSAISLFDPVMIGPGLLLVNQYFSCPLSELAILYISLFLTYVEIIHYDMEVCVQMAKFLNINIFSVDKRSPCLSSDQVDANTAGSAVNRKPISNSDLKKSTRYLRSTLAHK